MSLNRAREVLKQEAEAVLRLCERLDGNFETAVGWIHSCKGRVITCGIGKSGHIARKTAGTLSSTGTPSLFLHAAEAMHGDLGAVTGADILIAYSQSGETDEVVRLFPSFRAAGAKTILISGKEDSSAGRLADLVLPTYVTEEACGLNLAPTTSTVVMLALSDALALSVMERRGFSKEDFARFHPSGALGKRLLLSVSDVMRPLDEIAVVKRDTPVVELMHAISKAGVGAACVVENGDLVGLISDGDLRRHFLSSKSPLEGTAADLMTTSPSTISSEMMAVEALEVFQNLSKRIGEMPVVGKDQKLVGLVMLKDLLRSGIV
ncbi:MAG: KpsF/GutQ family sugar-phosphate isomerase [Armatimonadetes bacterium]|nr:KpsF/GutQ family sugar-phosphate isomerase [Armatimonadota bacterium]